MDFASILKTLEETSLADAIRNSLYLFPTFEALHVFGLAIVFGTILVIDLRLMGFASLERPYRLMAGDILKWTWAAFALVVVTGGLMFISNATVYANLPYFQVKMALLVLSGVNMAIFEATTGKRSAEWGQSTTVPGHAKIAGTLSILMWLGIIVTGRLIGFTTSNASVEIEAPPSDIDFDDFLGGDDFLDAIPDEPPAAEPSN